MQCFIWENKMKNTVVYQTEKKIWAIPRAKREEYVYEKELKPLRMALINTTQQFWEAIQHMTNEELVDILVEELKNNQETLYSN